MDVCGVDIPDIPDASLVVGVVIGVKYIDKEGDVSYAFRTSEGLTAMEAHAMLATQVNLSMIGIMNGLRSIE